MQKNSSTAKTPLVEGKRGGIAFLFVGAVLRLLLFMWGFDEVFSTRKEVVTPITNFHRVTEGLHLLKLNQSPYAGDVFHQPPLVLLLFYGFQQYPLITRLFFIILDIICALLLRQITFLWQSRKLSELANDEKPKWSVLAMANLPELTASIYLFNPLTIMSCVGMSTINLTSFSVFFSVYFALKGNSPLTMFWLSMATYLSIYPIVLLFPLSLLLKKSWFSPFLYCIVFLSGLLYMSFLMFHSWDFMWDTYGFTLLVADLSPNIGLFWYYFMEIFKHFQKFYVFAFQYHVFLYAIPLYLRLGGKHSMFLVWINVAIIATFKSYPAVGDISLQMAFIPLIFDEIKGAKNGFLIAVVGVFVMVLAPIFWSMWIYQGTGNANFYYAINLVLTVAQIMFMIDGAAAILKDDYLRKKELKEKRE